MSALDEVTDLEPLAGVAVGAEAPAVAGVLCPGAEMTIVHAAALREQFLQALQGDAGALSLDLGEVAEIDSSAVQLLLALQRSLREQGRPLQVLAVSRPVRELWQLFGLPPLLATD